MNKKSLIPQLDFLPFKIRTEAEIEEERREFFQGCERVVGAPASIFLEGNRFSDKTKLFPLPFYAYAGIEKGNFKRFMYEEFEWGKSGEGSKFLEKTEIRRMMPPEEKVIFRSETPLSSIKEDRIVKYQIYLNEEVKKSLIGKQEIEKAVKRGEISEFLQSGKGVDFKGLESKFKDYFKIKVWSRIPSNIGLNEGAAIAVAVAFLLVLEFLTDENRDKSVQNFLDLKINRPEEIIIDWFFMEIFTRALQLDFFSNGAAVFSSIMGNVRKQEAIDYECLFYNEIKRFFEPDPEICHKDIKSRIQAFEKVRKIKGINAYFDECSGLSKKTRETLPLFKWNHSRLDFKNKQELALSVMERRYISGEDRDFKIANSEVKLHLVSPASFVIIGEPSIIALCEKRPENYIFGKEKDEVYSKYSPLYSSRTYGWEVKGAQVVEFSKEKFRLEIIEDKEGLWYKNLGIKIDCGDKPKLSFYRIGEEGKEVLIKAKEKSFALLTRLAVAMKMGETKETGKTKGYVHIHPKKEKIEKCFKECREGYDGRCLYFEYRGKDKFREWLAKQEIFDLNRDEKKDLILYNRAVGGVRLAILPENIEIKNIRNISKLTDKLGHETRKSPDHQKGIELAKKLLEDACNVYTAHLKSQSNLPNRKL